MQNHTIEPRSYGDDCDGCVGPAEEDIARFRRGIRALMGKWKVEIVCCLIEGPLRFGELRALLPGVTQHMLTAQLRELEQNSIVIRRAFAEMPPRVEYELSQAGVDLMPTLRALRDWSFKYEHQFTDDDMK